MLLFAGTLGAQEPDTVVVRLDSVSAGAGAPDTTGVLPDRPRGAVGRWFSRDYPDPGKAALFSAILPGAGQVYNRKWWKLPLVYGVLGGLVYWEVDNVRTYRELRDNYRAMVDEDPATLPDPAYVGVSTASLKGERDNFRKYVELTALALGLAYLLNITDAFVDAHLARFDVGDDLSLRVLPATGNYPGSGASFGLGLQLEWGRKRPAAPRSPVPPMP
jgi:hypothetical protein